MMKIEELKTYKTLNGYYRFNTIKLNSHVLAFLESLNNQGIDTLIDTDGRYFFFEYQGHLFYVQDSQIISGCLDVDMISFNGYSMTYNCIYYGARSWRFDNNINRLLATTCNFKANFTHLLNEDLAILVKGKNQITL